MKRRELPRDEAVQHFLAQGEKYKAEIIASIPGRRADRPVRPGRLGRPVPRPARAVHRQAQGLQADEGGRRLLARRFAQRDAPAHLRHGLDQREGAQGLPAPPGRSREARPPQDRPRARPVPHAGRGARRGVLASEGLGHLPAPDRLHARRAGSGRLPGSERAGDHGRGAVAAVRATSRSSARTCS